MLKFPFVHDLCTLGFFCSRSLDLVFFINLLFIDKKKKKIPNLTLRLLYHVETKRRIVGGKNFLYFPLSHHTYIYKKVRLYIRARGKIQALLVGVEVIPLPSPNNPSLLY